MTLYLHVLRLLKLLIGESLCSEGDESIGLIHDRSGETHGERVWVFDATDKSLGMDKSAMGEDDLLLFDEVLSSITSNDSCFRLFLGCIIPVE